MKVSEIKCSASIEDGLVTLEDGTTIDLQKVYQLMAELREYAASSTLEGEDTPDCVFEADRLLADFS